MVSVKGFPTFLCKDFVTTSGWKPSGTAAVETRVITQVENTDVVNGNPLSGAMAMGYFWSSLSGSTLRVRTVVGS